MTKQVQRRRGTSTQHTSFTGAEGEISVNTTNKSVHVHDGVTAGGIEAARADMDNVSSADILAAIGVTASVTELNYVDGVTSNIQTQIDAKAPINNATFTGTTTVATADINGGTIDGTVIGATTPAAGTFSTATINGNITVTGTVDGRDVASDGTKLDGIEAGADVTDTANVTAAGALMDSELTNITAVKALNQGVATTDSPSFAAVTVDNINLNGNTISSTNTNGDITLDPNGTGNVVVAGPATFEDGSASAPSLTNVGDTNTGLFFPAADTVAVSTGGAERARIDASGNLLLGVTSAQSGAATDPVGVSLYGSGSGGAQGAAIFTRNSTNHVLYVNNKTSGGALVYFGNGSNQVGDITSNGTVTIYGTTSDYRLKENIAPMQNALDTVLRLNPVTYTWKSDGSESQGFIAHELQAVVPECVSGKKDAMREEQYEVSPAVPATYDDEGNVLTEAVEAVTGTRMVHAYQGIDTSFLVATLTKAIQEQQAIIADLTARVAALEA